MYTQQEFEEHYLEVTGNSPRHETPTTTSFEGYFKDMFKQIDDMFVQEFADGR